MKKVFMAALMLCAAQSACHAQEFRTGFTAGMTINTPTYFDAYVGYNVGFRGELSLKEASSVIYCTGLMLSDKSMRYVYPKGQTNLGVDDPRVKAHPTYLDIPVHAGYRWEVSPKVRIFATAGPTFSVGLFGKDKISYKTASDRRTKITTQDNMFDNELKRFDCSLGYRFGIELKREIQVSVGQDWGLRNIMQDESMLNIRHQCLTVAFTYMF